MTPCWKRRTVEEHPLWFFLDEVQACLRDSGIVSEQDMAAVLLDSQAI
jgi:hypothetical protein